MQSRSQLVTPALMVSLLVLAALVGLCIPVLASPVRKSQDLSGVFTDPGIDNIPASGPEATLVAVRVTAETAALAGGPLLLTIELVDGNGRVPAGLSPAPVRVHVEGSCTIRSAALQGTLLEGAGTADAIVSLHEGRAQVLASDPLAERVMVVARRLPSKWPPLASGVRHLQFLDPAADEDVDGLNNIDEFRRHTNCFAEDSDNDSVVDSVDNCPASPNPDQSDVRHTNGIGDACDDPDLDGAYDLLDNCPDRANPDQRDENEDGIGDACVSENPDAVVEDVNLSLPFVVTDVVFDPQRPYLYASDKSGKKVYFLNLETGLIEKEFSFDLMPESLALTPDASRLFVALLTREHDPFWFGAHEGYIASFDLQTQMKDRQFRIAEDPFDLIATIDGFLVVSPGSGQFQPMRVFNAVTGAMTGSTSDWYMASPLTFHSFGMSVYGVQLWRQIFRVDLQPGGGIADRWSWTDRGRVGGNIWASPAGDVLFTGEGDVFTAGGTIFTDMLFVQSLSAERIQDLAFDLPRRLILTAEGSALRYYNLTTRIEFGNQTLADPISFVGVKGERIYALMRRSAQTVVVTMTHPALAGASNTPPVARFAVTPANSGTILSDFRFDASSSSDAEDATSALRFRWDFDNDGTWDTLWSNDLAVVRHFATAGTKFIRLQVLDSLGLASEQTRSVDVVFEADPGQPRPTARVFELPFPVTDTAFDPRRPYLYVSSKTSKKVYFVNLVTGFIEKQFSFTRMPESLALTPDGSRLFVALLTQEHSPFWFDQEGHVGYIASIDMRTQMQDREFLITEDPYDLLATSDGHLIVPSGSGQHTHIKVFDSLTGAEMGEDGIWQTSRIALHPSEKWIYAADNTSSPSTLARYDLSTSGGITSAWSPEYPMAHRYGGNVWVSPAADLLITRGGDVFTAGDTFETDIQFVRSLAPNTIDDLAWAVDRDLVITLEGSAIHRYQLSSYALIDSVDLSSRGTFLGRHGSALFALVPQGSHTLVVRNAVHNRAPIANPGADSMVECTGPSGAVVQLDSSESDDPDSLPGTHDDIAALDWYENYGTPAQHLIGSGSTLNTAFAQGTHSVSLKVTDWGGLSSTSSVTVTVRDTTAPQISLSPNPSILWPPNHGMVDVKASVAVTDACGSASVVLTSLISSEADDASSSSDGNTSNDIQGAEPGTPDFDFQLRAERDGEGEGRVYQATYSAVDSSGNRSTASSLILVPHDQGGETEPLILTVNDGATGTILRWESVPGAGYYKAIRGYAGALREAGDFIDLGTVSCVTAGFADAAERLDTENPPIGEAFFYLVSYNDGGDSGYGSDTASKPRIKTAGGCE